MNKLLLALIVLSAGAGGVHTARQSTARLQQEANVLRENWLAHSQTVAVVQSELAGVNQHIRELKQIVRQSQSAAGNPLWSTLQTNRADHLPAELRERLRGELGFNWQFSPDYVVVSKAAVRDIEILPVSRHKLTDVAATVLAMTPEERSQVEAAIERVRTDFRDWALANVQRTEPKDDVVAQYALPKDPATSQNISNALVNAVLQTLGQDRTGMILGRLTYWMNETVGLLDCAKSEVTFKVLRSVTGYETTLNARVTTPNMPSSYRISDRSHGFPRACRILFPNAWADVAEREGFELPLEPAKK